MARRSLLREKLMRNKWVARSACALMALLPAPMWLDRHNTMQDREGRETRMVEVLTVTEQGNEDRITARIEDREVVFDRPGESSPGDEVEVYRDEWDNWRSTDDPPLWLPIAATALCWVPVALIVWKYPGFGSRRGWR